MTSPDLLRPVACVTRCPRAARQELAGRVLENARAAARRGCGPVDGLEGAVLPRAWITHDEVMTAGEMHLAQPPNPSTAWAATPAERPPSMTR